MTETLAIYTTCESRHAVTYFKYDHVERMTYKCTFKKKNNTCSSLTIFNLLNKNVKFI